MINLFYLIFIITLHLKFYLYVDISEKEGCIVDINSIMSSQLMELQQTVQMSVMQNALNLNASAAVELLEDMPQTQASHPYKGTAFDISV